MKHELISEIKPLGFTWEVANPFLFCAHHLDQYPAGNEKMGPAASLEGRNLGEDFTIRDGWRMYHGEVVPGFPEHPHRGFETVTIVRQGYVDHSDSHGQAGRYGMGDVQWMTAGAGLQHSEMFPLLNQERENTTELFQVWLNLPKARKFAEPYYKMLWNEEIPRIGLPDTAGKSTWVRLIAGQLGGLRAPAPAPDSWASDPANHVAIWTIEMEPGATWTLPPAPKGVSRNLYFYLGDTVQLEGIRLPGGFSASLQPDAPIRMINGSKTGYFLMLQGKPIDEPIVQYGPFVMNTETEIRQAFADYQKTRFGGWPWPVRENVFPREKGRFARYRDGKEITP